MNNLSQQQQILIGNAKNTISIKTKLAANIYQEKPGLYVSHCIALDLYSQGDTPEDAEKNIIEATEEFILFCLEHNTLNEVLEESGFYSVNTKPLKKKVERKSASPAGVNLRKIIIPTELPVMVA